MSTTTKIVGFELSLSARDDGRLEAAYIRFRNGKSDRTEEIVEDAMIADYDEHGNLLGIEIIAPVTLSKLATLVEKPRRPSFRKFMKHAAPPELVHA